MKVIGTVTEQKEFQISARAAFEGLKLEVLRRSNLRVDCYLDAFGRIVADNEHHTSHSWHETEILVGAPSQEQVDLIKAFSTISDQLRKLDKF